MNTSTPIFLWLLFSTSFGLGALVYSFVVGRDINKEKALYAAALKKVKERYAESVEFLNMRNARTLRLYHQLIDDLKALGVDIMPQRRLVEYVCDVCGQTHGPSLVSASAVPHGWVTFTLCVLDPELSEDRDVRYLCTSCRDTALKAVGINNGYAELASKFRADHSIKQQQLFEKLSALGIPVPSGPEGIIDPKEKN